MLYPSSPSSQPYSPPSMEFSSMAISPKPNRLRKLRRWATSTFYYRDILGGKTPSAVKSFLVHQNSSPPLASLEQRLNCKYLVTEIWVWVFKGKYNGNTLTILRRNPLLDDVREMPIVGGSGLFLFGLGYALIGSHGFVWIPKLEMPRLSTMFLCALLISFFFITYLMLANYASLCVFAFVLVVIQFCFPS